MSPGDAGFAFIRRPRRYYILTLRGVVRASVDLRDLYRRASVHLRCNTAGWEHWVWRASAQELLAEENAARDRLGFESVAEPSGDWTYMLTSQQRGYLESHRRQWHQCHEESFDTYTGILDLTQTPEWSRRRGEYIPTLRRRSARLWCPARRRWLTHGEKAACMGFPVSEDLAQVGRVPMDTATLAAPSFSIGNAMHVANVGVIIALTIVACDWV